MKILSFIAIMLVFVSTGAVAKGKKINTETSTLNWLGEKVTGEHSGEIKFKSGQLEFNGDLLTGGQFEVDMTSITNTDLTDAEYNQKLVGHLKSDDFFGVKDYPTSKLVLTSVSPTGGKYNVKADLTIKGQTHPVEFVVSQDGDTFTGTMVVDRTVYNIRYGSGKFFDDLGDKVIYDEFQLTFKVDLK